MNLAEYLNLCSTISADKMTIAKLRRILAIAKKERTALANGEISVNDLTYANKDIEILWKSVEEAGGYEALKEGE